MKRDGAQHRLSLLVHNVDGNLHAGALSIGPDHSPNLFGDAALTANDLPHVVGSDAQFQCQLLVAWDLRNGDCEPDLPPSATPEALST